MAAKRKAKAPAAPPEQVEIDRKTWERWQHARAQKAQWEAVEKKARAAMEAEIGDSPTATINGVPVISWKTTEKRNVFDAVSHAAEVPFCHASYMIKKDGTRPFNQVDFLPESLDEED